MKTKFVYITISFVSGLIISYIFFGFGNKVTKSIEMRGDKGVYTSTLLECLDKNFENYPNELNVSKPELQRLTNSLIKEYRLLDMSVYIRDLNNGPWIGINEHDDFIGGSLLKVPILIAYLKLADSNPQILDKEIEYKNKLVDNRQDFFVSSEIKVGETYKVHELLDYMIKYSDNNAAYLLYMNLEKKDFNAVFEALGFGEPDPNAPYIVNTVSYAGFFRILFNVSYLSKENSEKALELLSETEFKMGMPAPIPSTLKVSHKFGTRSDGTVNQLHDCGIVYYPEHPYLLCVMTKGGTFQDMLSSISKISKFIYDEVSINQK